jgi:hypothetical protein
MNTQSSLRHILRTLLRQERAQVIVLAAAAMVVVMGFAALAVDVGFAAHTKRDLQNDADAMALAGAREIPNQGLANSKALEWGTSNGVNLDEEVVSIGFGTTCSGLSEPNTITVRLERSQPTFLARVLGITSSTLHACATAGRFSLGGGIGAVPWGLEDTCFAGATFGQTYTLKYDSQATSATCDSHGGNFAAMGVDEFGAGPNCTSIPGPDEERKYRRAICFGAIRDLCTVSATDCVGEAGDDCAHSSVADHELCTETGNLTGPTKDGVEYRISHTSTACDTWEEVTYPEGGLRDRCNPWLAGDPATDSQRVVMVPIVHGIWSEGGEHKVTIVDFAIFFLEAPPQCTGNKCDIKGYFIQSGISGVGRATLDPNSSVTTVAIIE